MSLFYKKKEDRSIGFKDVFGVYSPTSSTSNLSESAYLSCLEYISKSIAKLPLEVLNVNLNNGSKILDYKDENYFMLNKRFNKVTTPYQAMKIFIEFGLHYGISGLYIDRVTKELYPVKINNIIVDDAGLIESDKTNPILYTCSLGNSTFDCLDRDLIVFRFGFSKDGAITTPIKDLAKNTIKSLNDGQDYLNTTFKNGGLGKIVIQSTSTIENKKELEAMQQVWDKLYTNKDNRVFTVPAGYTLTSLSNSLSQNDFMNIRTLSRKEICACFGLPSTILNDYEGISFSSLEQLQMQIYTDCLQPIMTQIEQEMSYKLLGNSIDKVIEFNEELLFKMDYKTKVDSLCKLKSNSILTANSVLRELGYADSESEFADELVLVSGYMPESLAKIHYTKETDTIEGGEGDGNKEIRE